MFLKYKGVLNYEDFRNYYSEQIKTATNRHSVKYELMRIESK